MACFEQLSPSSVSSPLLGMDTDSFSLDRESNAGAVVSSFQQTPTSGAAVVTSSSPAPTSSSFKRVLSSTSTSLSAVKDGSVTKLRKRRKSRAKPKAPIRQVSADTFNFRDIVHQFTGAPPISKPLFNQSSPCFPPMPAGITENHGGALCDMQHMPPALANASLSDKDALLAGALLAQSLKTLDSISSYIILQSSLSQDTPKESANTQTMRRELLSSCSSEQVGTACERPVAELEDFLLKGDSKLDTYFSLSCLLLNQIASQCRVLSNS